MRSIRLGTRGSKLALWQAGWVARALNGLPRGPEVEVVILRTKGDAVVDRPIAAVGSTGVFVKELEEALLRREVDFAVHSLKDLETRMPAGLVLGAVPARAPVEDCLVAPGKATVDTLPPGALVASGSPRRVALLRDRRPDLRFGPLRGNVETRIAKVMAGEAAATVLARAGLSRLEMMEHATEVLDPVLHPPAPGQGALGIQCRAGDAEVLELLRLLDDPEARAAVTAERAFLRTLGSGCHLAAGAYGRFAGDGRTLLLDAFVGSARTTELHRGDRSGPGTDADSLGNALARELLGRASSALVHELATGNHTHDGPGGIEV
ncbi:MAG: hydroxymethylbilane synthase [Planctomycetes bacterium]|nr:hydroxymethylbilane synthase [Planctomycetota bacterium]